MKRTKIIALAAALTVLVAVFPVLAQGNSAGYSSEIDPLVSLSYINDVITPAYDKKIAELNSQITVLTSTVGLLQTSLVEAQTKLDSLSGAGANTGLGQYEVVFMQKGSKLMAKSPCEIILRTGNAIAVSIISNGLNDITNGTEILNAAAIPLYHCLIVPRGDDGRGIQITSNDAYVMVRGDYEVVQ